MAKLQVSLIWPGSAQGKYSLRARGFMLAELFWGDVSAPLTHWGPFAYVPIDPVGNGSFFFSGLRSIPQEATHVWAKCVSHDFTRSETVSAEIPTRFLPCRTSDSSETRFSLLTDLHLSSKPWNVRRALCAAQSEIVLLLGDSTNDGRPEQFQAFEACVDEVAPDRIVLPVIGNHDVLHPKWATGDGTRGYAAFQDRCLRRAEACGLAIDRDPDSLAWAARIGALELIGLQCVISDRQFRFPNGRQLDWLQRRLSARADAAWRLILCHAPLLAHNPNRNDGQPYLDMDRRLQALIDATGNILFLSGHTHVSPNLIRGSAEWDVARNNLYLNCGSVVDTDIAGEGGLMAADWKDGCVAELTITDGTIEVDTRSVASGTHFPRGYYRVTKGHAV